MANLPAGALELGIRPELNGRNSGNIVRIYRPEHFAPNRFSTIKGLTPNAVLEEVAALKEEVRKCKEEIQVQDIKLNLVNTLSTKVDSMETETEELQKGLDVLKIDSAYFRLKLKMQGTDIVALHARAPYYPLALESKRLAKQPEDAKRGYRNLLLELDNFTADSGNHITEEAQTLIDQVGTSRHPHHNEYDEANFPICINTKVNTVVRANLVHPERPQLLGISTLGTTLAKEALSAIDSHSTVSALAIQTPTLPSKTGKAYCLGTYQNQSNVLTHLAEAKQFNVFADNATSADPDVPLMKQTSDSKFALMNAAPDIPAPSTPFIQNMDGEMAHVAAVIADENLDAINLPLPPSPSEPYLLSALSPWASKTASGDENADGGPQRLFEENKAELKARKRVPVVPGAFTLVLQSFVACWIALVLWILLKVLGLRIAISFYALLAVALMILVKHCCFD